MATVTGNGPKWVMGDAREYAEAHGLETLSLSEYYRTAAYREQARRNEAAVAAIARADILATGGEIDSQIDDRTPRHPEDWV